MRRQIGSRPNWAVIVQIGMMTFLAISSFTSDAVPSCWGWFCVSVIVYSLHVVLAARWLRTAVLGCALVLLIPVWQGDASLSGRGLTLLFAVGFGFVGIRGLRRADREAFSTEDLVGRTVAGAVRRIGYDEGRAPAGLARPELLPMQDAALDLTDPNLTVVAVVTDVDATGSGPTRIWFGVRGPRTRPFPVLIRRESPTRMRVELEDLTGGTGPGVLRPLRYPPQGSRSVHR